MQDARSRDPIEWDLFLDESGTFGDPVESERVFPAQIAGVLAARGRFLEADADAFLARTFAAAAQPYPSVVHGVELFHGQREWAHLKSWPERKTAYAGLIAALTAGLAAAGLQPVRLVNVEGIRHRDRIEAQVAMTAALVARIALGVSRSSRAPVRLFLHLARVTTYDAEGTRTRIAEREYVVALQTELALTMVRHDLPAARWQAEVAGIQSASASRRLQVCDLISHASHDNFSPIDSRAAQALRAAFAALDFSLALPLAIEQAERSLAAGSVAMAIQLVAEREIGRLPQSRQAGAGLIVRAVATLAELSDIARGDQLEQLLAWMRRIVAERRDFALADATCRWILDNVETPLVQRIERPAELAWFRFALRAWMLTSLNQQGRLTEGRKLAAEMEALIPEVAGLWDHSASLLGGLVTIAVHEMHCREFASAAARAEAVAGFYGSLSELFSAAMPGVFPERVRSSLRGKALGTALQARLGLGLNDEAAIAAARRLSDEGLFEFESKAARARQHQYRALLETICSDFPAARKHLGLALDTSADHAALSTTIAAIPTLHQGFPLLHWLRLGTAAHVAGDAAEAQAFLAAFEAHDWRGSDWCHGKLDRAPNWAIMLHLAVLEAALGDVNRSSALLRRLANLHDQQPAPTLAVVVAVGFARVAALHWSRNDARARQLLMGGHPKFPALSRVLPALRQSTADFPSHRVVVEAIADVLVAVAADSGHDDLPAHLVAAAGALTI
jgi:hypothetical protein